MDKEKLAAIFGELEFRALAKKVLNEEISTETTITESASPKQATLFGDASAVTNDNDESNEEAPAGNLQTIDTIPHQYHLADTVEKRKSLIAQLENVKSFCFDTETTNIDANNAELVGLSFAITPHEACDIPVPSNYDEARELGHEFKSVFVNKNIGKTGQNIK